MKILIQFPTRERTEKFFSVIQQYYAKAENINECLFHIVIDADDSSMNNPTVLAKLRGMRNCIYTISNTPGKIKAINTMPADNSWNILLLLSDDMIVQAKGWDTHIRANMKRYFPTTDGVLWYNDGFVQDRLNTLVCMGRRYYARFNYIYHPSYISLWSDNEFTDVAKALKKQVYIAECIIRHEHVVNMGRVRDKLCDRNESYYTTDEKNYNKRKANGFRS